MTAKRGTKGAMAPQPMVFSVLLLASLLCIGYTGADTPAGLQTQCTSELSKLMGCLDYSTGKASVPSDNCCRTTKDMKDQKPACLCFLIQQTSEGNPQIRQLGLKVDRLLQLPTDCRLANASTSDCPRLLNLSPSSPDYAIFTNRSAAAALSNSTTSPSSHSSDGYASVPHFSWAILIVAALVFFKL